MEPTEAASNIRAYCTCVSRLTIVILCYSYLSLHTPYLRFLHCCCSSTSAADTRCSCSCWRQQGHLAQPKARSAGRSFSPSTTRSASLRTFCTLLLHLLPAAGFDCDPDIGQLALWRHRASEALFAPRATVCNRLFVRLTIAGA